MKLKNILTTEQTSTSLLGDTFKIQNDTAEQTVSNKSLWGNAGVWRYKIENAGDILRELSGRGDRPSSRYLGEKVAYITRWLSNNYHVETDLPPNVTLDDIEKSTLRFTDVTDGYPYLKKFHRDTLSLITKQYEKIPVYTVEQDIAKKLVLSLLKNDVVNLKKYLKEIVKIIKIIERDRTLTQTPL